VTLKKADHGRIKGKKKTNRLGVSNRWRPKKVAHFGGAREEQGPKRKEHGRRDQVSSERLRKKGIREKKLENWSSATPEIFEKSWGGWPSLG